MHGSLVLEKALLPIGQLSEEAAEARNKIMLEISTESMRHVPRKTTKPFLKETLEMLLSAEPTQSVVDVCDEEEPIIKTEESSDEEH
ncbi:hypothetical protein ILUMI_22506 [Ignelater luminosus]|uniref:Uncharacterized protein n=1 Tax=Ignelater luminosus TaxID=2038154 RepID=A0A8K0CCN7_IGNLU|nr:hypothetical protein ILUMI_22506 [Ignelater luminosus]